MADSAQSAKASGSSSHEGNPQTRLGDSPAEGQPELIDNVLPDSATPAVAQATESPSTSSHGKRKDPDATSSAQKRVRRSEATSSDQPVAGPSRLPHTDHSENAGGGELLSLGTSASLATDELPRIDRVFRSPSASDHYSPAGELLYPDATPRRQIPGAGRRLRRAAASDAMGSGAGPSHEGPIDVDALLDNTEAPPRRLAAQGTSSTIGSMSLSRLLNFEEEDELPSTPPEATQPAESSGTVAESSTTKQRTPPKLSGYNCPICFSPPTFATMTPCGHVCCAECLFTAVKTTIQRSMYHGPAASVAK